MIMPHQLSDKRSTRNNQLQQQHTILHDGNYGRVQRATTGRDARPPDSPDCDAAHSGSNEETTVETAASLADSSTAQA